MQCPVTGLSIPAFVSRQGGRRDCLICHETSAVPAIVVALFSNLEILSHSSNPFLSITLRTVVEIRWSGLSGFAPLKRLQSISCCFAQEGQNVPNT